MNSLTSGDARSRLAAEFESRGWEYDLTAGRAILEAAEKGESRPEALAELAPASFLAATGATKSEIADAVRSALEGSTVRRDEGRPAATLIIEGDSYSFDFEGAQITGSNFNIGPGTQITLEASAAKDDVLSAIAAMVAGGLAGGWNQEAARKLAALIASRQDVGLNDVKTVTAGVVEAEEPEPGRVKAFLEKVAASGLGGALATGISAGLGALL